ncbi:MAG: DNA polymerase A family protein [Desulfobulbaceae bacterium]|nr:DNA polymerase A family protein [Desulfobulbaceae bacterium]
MLPTEILTFDLETGTNKLNKRKASFRDPKNYIVAAGYKIGHAPTFGEYFDERPEEILFPNFENIKLLVGQNIKFDLLWTWQHKKLQAFLRKGGTIWDTQLAEYIIEGMVPSSQMASMNQMVEKYGGTLKIDAVKEMWDAGIDTPDIPRDLLMKYLTGCKEEEIEGDVNNTFLIFLGQLARIRNMHPNTMQMIRNRMDSILATTEMEHNGLCIDKVLGDELREEVKLELDILDEKLAKYLPEFPPEFTFNWNSIYHKSYLIYGGTARYDKWVQHRDEETDELLYSKKTVKHPLINGEPVDPWDEAYWGYTPDTFKSGKRVGQVKTKNVQLPDYDKPKGRIQDHFFKFDGYTQPEKRWASTLTDGDDKPIFSTAADIIEILGTRNIPFLKDLSARQKLSKDLGTYYWDEDSDGNRKGMLTLVDAISGCIHHSLNHTQTVTSRMSSSNPNGQNIPRKDKSRVKSVFISRFGRDGRIVELDYSSLEVVVQAVLTRDPQMIKDLLNGVDFHCKRLALKLNRPYDEIVDIIKHPAYAEHKKLKLMRTNIKEFTFQRAYGASAYSIAASTGMDVEEVKDMIALENIEYKNVDVFDRMLEQAIESSAEPTGKHLFVAGGKYEVMRGHWYSPTGTKFVWEQSETPDFLHKHGKFVGFSPTERKNYPVQGVGGEIVQTMLGVVWRWLLNNDHFGGQVKLINTVHDSIYLDMHKDMVEKVVPTVKAIMEAVPRKYKKDFDLDFPVPFPVEAEVGLSMYDTVGYDEYIASPLNQ